MTRAARGTRVASHEGEESQVRTRLGALFGWPVGQDGIDRWGGGQGREGGGVGLGNGRAARLFPTGKQIRIDVVDIVRVVHGKMVEHWGVADTLGAMLQLGLAPRP